MTDGRQTDFGMSASVTGPQGPPRGPREAPRDKNLNPRAPGDRNLGPAPQGSNFDPQGPWGHVIHIIKSGHNKSFPVKDFQKKRYPEKLK